MSLSKKGAINLHGSLLPQYRGAAPIQHALLNGDVLTGISTFLIDKNLDTGPIILQKKIPIMEEDTYDSLSDKMAGYGIGLIIKSLDLLGGNEFIPIPQAKNKVRALCYKGAFTFLNGKRIKIYDSKVVDINKNSNIPGEIRVIDNSRITVNCGNNKLELLEIQVEGKQRMPVVDWLKGAQINSGDYLG